MTLKHVLKLFSKTEVQEDKTHPSHLSQTILNRLFGRVLEREGVSISCAEHTEKNLSSNRLIVLTTLKKAAFTLAEVLITLGIIGVVAALTIPAVIKNKENMELQSALKLAYSTLNQALLLYQNDNGIPLKPEDIGFHQLKPILLKYIKNAKDCGWGTEGEKACMPSKKYVSDKENYKPIYKTFNGENEIIYSYFDDGQFIMNNSMFVMLENPTRNSKNLFISVDINGINKKPNRLGQDLFMFQIVDDGRLLPMGADGTHYSEKHCQVGWNATVNGAGCTNKALREKDFFKNLPK